MKPRKAFYQENLDTIKELEDRVYDLTVKMENECGHQAVDEKLNLAWYALYETWKDNIQ